jgi:TolB-like protein/tetratricopeptide (TPR) repeat protein
MPNIVRFGCFEVDLEAGQLRKRGTRVKLRDQSFQVLASLLEHPGRVVTRENLRQRLWRGEVFVDFDNNLNIVVARLREALGDAAEHPRFIETLPKRGYRFLATVSEAAPAAGDARARRVRLVVLPFVNLSGDPAEEYFSDAMTEEIITALASLAPEQLAVIARTTAMQYKASRKDVAQIGRELDVGYVVEGGTRRIENRVAINVQLIQTSDQMHLFAKKYEAEMRDVFTVHNSIAQEVATRIPAAAEISGTGDVLGRRAKKPTENLAAYNEYIQGRYLVERLTPESIARAKQHFEAALAMDPGFALANMALADLYSFVGYFGYMRPKDAYSIGLTYALRAVELDDTLAEAHAVLAEYHKQLDYNWPAAEREMARALQLNCASPFVRLRHAVMVLMPHKRLREAVAEIERALETDPLAVLARGWLAVMWLLAREYDRAIKEAQAVLELEAASPFPHFFIGAAYRQKYFEELVCGHPKNFENFSGHDFARETVAEHLRAIELSPGTDYFLGWLGLALGVCGRKAQARAVLEKLQRSEHYILPTSLAYVHLGLGEFDAAFEWFERAIEERDQTMMPILSYAHFDPLRQDPRFAVLVRKMNLEQGS